MTLLAARNQDAGISDSHEAIWDASCGDIQHTINPAHQRSHVQEWCSHQLFLIIDDDFYADISIILVVLTSILVHLRIWQWCYDWCTAITRQMMQQTINTLLFAPTGETQGNTHCEPQANITSSTKSS